MAYLRVDELKTQEPIPKVSIHSLEGGIYIATSHFNDQSVILTDSKGKPLKTQSVSAMRRHLKGIDIKQAELRQLSAYDEMIGFAPSEADEMVIPLGKDYNDIRPFSEAPRK